MAAKKKDKKAEKETHDDHEEIEETDSDADKLHEITHADEDEDDLGVEEDLEGDKGTFDEF